MIETRALSKRFATREAIVQAEFLIPRGKVTALLGPNGAGKTTLMRLISGLALPSGGEALVDGLPIHAWSRPQEHLGSLVGQAVVHPSWTVEEHLIFLALTQRIPRSQVLRTMEECGLLCVRGVRGRKLSQGIRQRLGVAVALLGNPNTLIFDEPMNGLDLDAVYWLRNLVRGGARAGRSILISSHQLKEIQEIADDLLLLVDGQIHAHCSVEEFLNRLSPPIVIAASSDNIILADRLKNLGLEFSLEGQYLRVAGVSCREVGEIAWQAGLVVHELCPTKSTLEEAYTKFLSKAEELGRRSGEAL